MNEVLLLKRFLKLIFAGVVLSFCLAAFYFFKFQPSAQTAQAAGDYHYVRAGATGLNNGSDWNNAWTSLPATLVRGDTYYIADGRMESTFLMTRLAENYI